MSSPTALVRAKHKLLYPESEAALPILFSVNITVTLASHACNNITLINKINQDLFFFFSFVIFRSHVEMTLPVLDGWCHSFAIQSEDRHLKRFKT